ncbi:hypothetical protein SAMN04488004_1198 [Loktanella salsilacus]|uniref:Uncharacterized protein n=1 Tax=Loktanella salsilacus TaxID=195913 RepID=A0A1I4HP24_9RHOB|nr:hypothetical protein SAMN04488004_1198 [Loktanella salsilacus]
MALMEQWGTLTPEGLGSLRRQQDLGLGAAVRRYYDFPQGTPSTTLEWMSCIALQAATCAMRTLAKMNCAARSTKSSRCIGLINSITNGKFPM